MTMPDERWMGRIETKIEYIMQDTEEINRKLEIQNGRLDKVELMAHDNEKMVEKNCKGISGLYKKIKKYKEASLSRMSKTSIIVAVIGSISAIIIALLAYYKGGG